MVHKNWLERTELLLGEKGLHQLQSKHVLIVGLGGVGSFAAEFIARSGIGKMTIIDGDHVDPTNINRQLPALHSTVGKDKSEIVKNRLLDINPSLEINAINEFLQPERMKSLLQELQPDFVMDCIDSFKPKLNLISTCYWEKIPLISAMGAGGKMKPERVSVVDISKSYNCKMASMLRKRLKRDHGIYKGFKVVFSSELQKEDSLKLTDGTNFKKSFYGTNSYMPGLFGLHAAAHVIQKLSP